MAADSWNFWDTSYDQPNTTETVPTDVVMQSQAPQAPANDGWSDFWKTTTKGLISYGIAKDAAQTGVQLRQANQPVYAASAPQMQAAARQSNSGATLILLLLVGVGLASASK